MIEQLHYTTTSRYNFSQALVEPQLPRQLVELSLESMSDAKGRLFQPFETEFIESPDAKRQFDGGIDLRNKVLSTLLTPLKPILDGTSIVGVDVSGIRIGETETGIICAIRGAIVWNERQRYRYIRLGPFPFHITEENKREIFKSLEQESSLSLSSSAFTTGEEQSQLCNMVERCIQANVSCSSNNNIILWDGSLTTGTPGNPTSAVSQILKIANKNSNAVLAFSKTTTIRFLGWRITNLVLRQDPPCLFEIEDLPLSISKSIHLLGKIYVAKLTNNGCSFRLDIDRILTREDGIMAVEKLLGNELLFQGYPETLRLAHIYSTFTANEVIGIQSFLAREYSLKVAARYNIRKVLFGPYGTGFGD